MLLRPNVECMVYPVKGVDEYGEDILGAGRREMCAVVKLTLGAEKTSVRADSSASRGAAHEFVADARLLFPSDSKIAVNDRVELGGYRLKVVSIFPRFGLDGEIDHYQVDLAVWGDG